ncbi:hypothetical protein AMECASPLE_013110 [Ameca splendens]|uniref:Uncharacterized protein n=1 Tax=Ameca splendens TaxID=208324 RepID=A0ABV0YND8_9TELE
MTRTLITCMDFMHQLEGFSSVHSAWGNFLNKLKKRLTRHRETDFRYTWVDLHPRSRRGGSKSINNPVKLSISFLLTIICCAPSIPLFSNDPTHTLVSLQAP